jgi:hypothetical protein
MCPACITTAALIVAGATSTDGLTAVVPRGLSPRRIREAGGTLARRTNKCCCNIRRPIV